MSVDQSSGKDADVDSQAVRRRSAFASEIVLSRPDASAEMRRSWRWIVLAALAAGVFAAFFGGLQPPKYQSSAEIYVGSGSTDTADSVMRGARFASQQITSYVDVARTSIVLDAVAEDLGIPGGREAIMSRVGAQRVAGTNLIRVTATARDGEAASDLANAVAAHLADAIDAIDGGRPGVNSPVGAEIVTNAGIPVSPASPSWAVFGAVGLIAGAAIAAAIALLRARR